MTTCISDINKAKFIKLANDLAIYFPEYLLHTPQGHWNVYFEHKTIPSKGFYLNPDNYKGKFTVSPRIIMKPYYSFGDVYNDKGDKVISPDVGFSIDREPSAIAKGINSRFMPDFEIYYKEWMGYWQKQHNYKCGKENTIKEVAALLNVEPAPAHASSDQLRETLNTYHSDNKGLKEYISSIRVSSSKSITIETNSLNMEQARKLIEFIKTL
jgi:hypothetical protein